MAAKIIRDTSVSCADYKEIHYSWIIENLSMFNEQFGDYIESPKFPESCDNGSQWILELHLGNTIEIHPKLVSQKSGDTGVQYTFSLLNKEGQLIIKKDHFSVDEFDDGDITYGYPCFGNRYDTLSQLEDDVLVVICVIKSEINIVDDRDKVKALAESDVQANLSNDLDKLFENGTLSDISLTANDETRFLAHKSMLAARSPVFAAMLEHNMKESNESVIKIEDINANSLRAMLCFIYSGKLDVENCEMEGLLVAADKYDIKDLKVMCELELGKRLNTENAIDLLLLADRHSAKTLKTQTLKLISESLKAFVKTEAMRSLTVTHPSLLNDIFETVTDKLM